MADVTALDVQEAARLLARALIASALIQTDAVDIAVVPSDDAEAAATDQRVRQLTAVVDMIVNTVVYKA